MFLGCLHQLPSGWMVRRVPDGCWTTGQGPVYGNGQLAICGRFRCKQPYLFSGLDGILLVPVPAGAVLEGTGELDLDHPMSLELMILQPANVTMAARGVPGKRHSTSKGVAGSFP